MFVGVWAGLFCDGSSIGNLKSLWFEVLWFRVGFWLWLLVGEGSVGKLVLVCFNLVVVVFLFLGNWVSDVGSGWCFVRRA